MTFQPGANLYTAGFGSRPENVEVPHLDVRAPSATDVMYPIGKQWVDSIGKNTYFLVSLSSFGGITTATWEKVQAAENALLSLSDGTTLVFPDTNGTIQLVGTTNQITTVSDPSFDRIFFSLANPLIFPGAITANLGAVTLGSVGDFTVRIGSPASTAQTVVISNGHLVNIGAVGTGSVNLDGDVNFVSTSVTSVAAGATFIFDSAVSFNFGFDVNVGTVNFKSTVNNTSTSTVNNQGTMGFTSASSTTFASGAALVFNNEPIFNNGLFVATGPIIATPTLVTGPTTVTPTGHETTFLVTTVGGPVTIALGSIFPIGTRLIVADTNGNAGTNNITLTTTGTFLVSGGIPAASYAIAANFGSVTLLNAGSSTWSVLSKGG